MTAVWSEDDDGWHLLSPAGFPNEQALHELVAQAPDLLPLSGSPQLVVLGSEVLLGSGYADVLAIEPSGRPVIVEVKLRNNSESRRAVVSQILAYAAALYELTAEQLERDVLAGRLDGRTLFDVVHEKAQSESPTSDDFYATLEASLRDGSFRLVLVLDQVPDDLVRLVGYLEAVTDGLSVDLVTVTAYAVAGRRVVVPQRVEPGRRIKADTEPAKTVPAGKGQRLDGVEPFREYAAKMPAEHQDRLRAFADWADRLAAEHLAKLSTSISVSGAALLPHLIPDRVGLVTLWSAPNGAPSLQVWRSVFERRAPRSIEAVVANLNGQDLGQGTIINNVTDTLLRSLYDAYREANERDQVL